MKSFTFAAAALALVLPAFAQDLSGLPTCAQTPALAAISSSGCALTDIKCICSNTAFIQGLATAIGKVCSPADVAATDAFAAQLCATAGVTLPAAAPSPSASSSAAVVKNATATTSTVVVSTAASNATTVKTPSPTAASSTPKPQFTGAAYRVGAGSLLGLVAVGLAVVL